MILRYLARQMANEATPEGKVRRWVEGAGHRSPSSSDALWRALAASRTWAASTSRPSRPIAPTPSASADRYAPIAARGLLDLLWRRSEDLVGDGDLVGVDGPPAVEPEQAGADGAAAVPVRVLVRGIGSMASMPPMR
jgi:hypothetical protein